MATVRKKYVGLHIPEAHVDVISRDLKRLILDPGALSKETIEVLFVIHQGMKE